MSGLLSAVNATGFAFQLAVEELVRSTTDQHGWSVTSREHAWLDGAIPRFIDLVLTQGKIHLVIECKRQKGGQWVFLVPDPLDGRRAEQRRWFRGTHLRNADSSAGRSAVTGLANFQLLPTSWESSFCAMPGASDGKDKPLPILDRLCAELTRSTDAITGQQLQISGRRNQLGFVELPELMEWVAIPVLVTTGVLQVCVFDPATVTNGEIPSSSARFEQVNAVRYRKSFDVHPGLGASSLSDLERKAQRTVAIINEAYLRQWLRDFTIDPASYSL